jgi:hypothetical protein
MTHSSTPVLALCTGAFVAHMSQLQVVAPTPLRESSSAS